MDRTLVNIVSILVGGAGLFTVVTGFNVPQLNMAFWGENPFAVKRDVIEETLKWVFTIVALAGLVIQLWAEIWGAYLPDRSHDARVYISASVGGLIAVGLMVWLLTGFGNWVAKFRWQPKVVALQSELFDRTKFAVEHEGWTPEHWEKKDDLTRAGEADVLKANGLRDADTQLTQIEDLLDLTPQGDLRDRLAVVEPYFRK